VRAIMTKKRIHHLDGEALRGITLDARVAALRWDVVPWGLVIDLDSPASEAKDAPMRRAWLAFPGLSELSWPFAGARLPNGCWLTSRITCVAVDAKFREYRFLALLPRFSGDDVIVGVPSQEVMIRSMGMVGIASEETSPPTAYGLPWAERISLARDEEMVVALADI
jgi:hypothetical protein